MCACLCVEEGIVQVCACLCVWRRASSRCVRVCVWRRVSSECVRVCGGDAREQALRGASCRDAGTRKSVSLLTCLCLCAPCLSNVGVRVRVLWRSV